MQEQKSPKIALMSLEHAVGLNLPSYATMQSAGMDLTGLLVGSEGTLGMFSELTLKLKPIKPTKTAWMQFDSFKAAVKCSANIRSHMICNKMEFIDPAQYDACITHSKYQFEFAKPNKYNILIEYQVTSGSEDALLLAENPNSTIVEDAQVIQQIWHMRKQAGFAALTAISAWCDSSPSSRGAIFGFILSISSAPSF